MDLPDKKLGCHHTGFQIKCHKLVTTGVCNRWINVIGADPQTGETFNRFDCADNWHVKLLLENAQQSRQTGASVDKVANEVRRASEGAAERDVHLINGIKASFPLLRVVDQLDNERLLEQPDDQRER